MNGPSDDAAPRSWTTDDLRGNPHETPDKSERVRHMFAAIARRYDLNNRLHSFGRDQAWRRAAVRSGLPDRQSRVLDVACGTGDLTLAFAQAGVGSVIGVDFTEPMLKIAREKAAHPSGGVDVTFEHGDATSLRFEDGSFDIVSIAFGLRNVDDPARALREMRRVLAPGGRVVVLEFSKPRNPLMRLGNDLYTRRIMPWTATLISGDGSGAYRYLPRSVATFPEGESMISLLRSCGFEDVDQRRLTFGVCSIYRGFVREPSI